MKKLFSIPIIILLLTDFNISYSQPKYVKIVNGKLNLEKANFSKNTYYLDGLWEFYPNKLLTPSDFKIQQNLKPEYIKVNGLWSDKENLKFFGSGKGYGTYRLKIKTRNKKELLALNINRIQSSYSIYINGVNYGETGKVGVNKSMSEPAWSSKNYHFLKETDSIEIVIQVSNFYHKKGGIENSVTISSSANIDYAYNRVFGFDVLILGVILIMGLYHLGMFILRPKDISSLYFSLTMFFSASFSLTTGEIIFTRVFEQVSWEILLKTNYISNYLRLLFFVLFLNSLFKSDYPQSGIKFLSYIAIAMIAFVLVTPASVYTHTLIFFLIVTAIGVTIIVYGIVLATIRKRHGAHFSLVGILILTAAVVNDFMLEFHIIKSISLATLGFFIFVFLQAYMLSLQTSFKYKEERKITSKLNILGELKDGFLSANYLELHKPLEVLKKITDADRAILIINENQDWFLKADVNGKSLSTKEDIKIINEKHEFLFDKVTALQSIKSKENIIFDATNTYLATPYTKEHKISEAFYLPVKDNNTVTSLIILENKKKSKIFNNSNIAIIESAGIQFSTFIETYKTYNQISELNESLEEKVIERMSEILEQNQTLEKQRDEIEKRNRILNDAYIRIKDTNQEINDSINYAKKIQNSLLPGNADVKALFPKSYIIYKPKDILSGDFYWTEAVTEKGNNILFFAVADCTGHGVPGSLMSIVGNNLLSDTILSEKITDTAQILNSIHEKILHRLNKDIGESKFNDTIDIAIIKYQKNENKIQYSGARHPLILIRNGQITEIQPDRMSIGEVNRLTLKNSEGFKSHTIEIQTNDQIYMLSDGYYDQIGGKHNRKFMKKNFLNLINEIYNEPLERQHKILSETIIKWQKNNAQTDDILVTAIQF